MAAMAAMAAAVAAGGLWMSRMQVRAEPTKGPVVCPPELAALTCAGHGLGASTSSPRGMSPAALAAVVMLPPELAAPTRTGHRVGASTSSPLPSPAPQSGTMGR